MELLPCWYPLVYELRRKNRRPSIPDNNNMLVIKQYLYTGTLGVCNTGEFYCTLDGCIHASYVCDGTRHCLYGNDETECDSDHELPEFVRCPNDITVNTDPGTNYTQVSWWPPKAYDNRGIKYRGQTHWPGWDFYLVDGNSTVHHVRYSAVDYSGNTGECVFRVTIIDDEPPKLECPKNISNFYNMEYGFFLISTDKGSPNATITWTEVATDNSAMPQVTSFPYKSGDVFPMRLFPPYETTVRAADPTGNTDECILRFAVVDIESPVVHCPTRFNSYNYVVRTSTSSWTVFPDRDSTPVQLYWSPASATDNSGTVVSVSSNYNPGDVFPVNNIAYQITYTAIDEAGNVGNCSSFITIKAEDDDEGGDDEDRDGGSGSGSGDGIGEGVCNSTEFQCDNQNCIPISLQCDGNTDCSDESDENNEICKHDNELPEFVRCPNDIMANTNPGTNYKQVNWRHPEAYDNKGIKYRGASHWPGWNYYLIDGNSTVYTVRYWADDFSGNSGECVFTVTVIDNEPPKQDCPKNISNFYKIEDGFMLISTDEGSPNASITWMEVATDNSGIPQVTSFPYKSGDVFPMRRLPPYETTVRASDPTGNTDECILRFAVVDTEIPVVTCPTQSNNIISRESNSSWTVFPDKGSTTVKLYWSPANATDNSDTAVTLSSNYKPGDVFPVSKIPHQITYTAIDEAGNVGNCSFFMTVKGRTYHGCFEDTTWTSAVPKYNNLTIDWCIQHCYNLSYPYAGLQDGVFCQCMGVYLEFYRKPEHECSTVCSGKPQEICGGDWHKSIYNTERVCNSIEYQCDNQDCIPISLQCDGNTDCLDQSDETSKACMKKPCRGNQFDCGKGRVCIPLKLYCDGNNDCEDGIDEANCDYPKFNGCPDDISVGSSQGQNYTDVWWTEPVASDNTAIRTREQSHSPGNRFDIIDGNPTMYTVRYWAQDVYLSEGQCLFNITVFPRTYLGCFRDTTWTSDVPKYNSLTIDWCIQHCHDLSYNYAGLQYGVYCRCISELTYYYITHSSSYQRSEHECNMDCGGNSREICGGSWRMSVYTTGYLQLNGCPDDLAVITDQGTNYTEVWWTEPEPSSLATHTKKSEQSHSPGHRFETIDGKPTVYTVRYWVQDVYLSEAQCLFNITVIPRRSTYRGCFNAYTSAVPKYDLTIDWCIQHCYDFRYLYAELHDGVSCECRDEHLEIYRRSEVDCNTVCSGNSLDICGGNFRKSIYATERVCNSKEFQCDNQDCIPISLQCDDTTDCFDKSDEKVEMCQSKPCRDNQFDCGKDKLCIPLKLYCNGNNDCEDGIDEATCDYPQLNGCPVGLFVRIYEQEYYKETWWTEPTPSSVTTIKARKQSHTPGQGFAVINEKPTVYTVRYWVQDVYLNEAECLFNITLIPAYHGCFKDYTLTSDVPSYTNLTIDWCVQQCYELQYPYAGLQHGVYCRCMNEYLEKHRRSEYDCFSVCSGNSREQCGGKRRKSIYTTVYPHLDGCPDDLTVDTNQGENYTEVWWAEPNLSSYTTIKIREQSHSPGHRFEVNDGKPTVYTVRYWVQDVYLKDAQCLFNITVIERVCNSTAFQCDNQDCIPISLQCDRTPDCSDESDEKHEICMKKPCRDNQFDCGKGKLCIPLALYCNGNNDCEDGTDEATCDYPQLNGCPGDLTVGTSQGKNYTEVWWAEPNPPSLTTIKKNEQSHSPGDRFEVTDGKPTVHTVQYWVQDVYLMEAQCLFNITVIPRTYHGCFKDTTWTSAVPQYNNLTIDWCIQECYKFRYPYAGLQVGYYCR
ncbi:uncharacterized protein LOC117120218 [Anneissia japonica]|uniref:uncharacterized protein LOC117120218 n=1 Tax=Anneissia japonica TaxID=1529436 RepID=UPI00142559B7|nr:uncharacterized protein LOC117120218 [Anneissia japonica]